MRVALVLVLGACGRIGFGSGDATSVHATLSAASGVTVVDADARILFGSLDPDQLHAIPSAGGTPTLPAEVTYDLPGESGPLVLTVNAHDTLRRALVATASLAITADHQHDVAIVIGGDLAAACVDGQLGGDESDTDCGGSCPACAIGDVCVTAFDCATRACNLGVCEPVTGPPSWRPIMPLRSPRIGMGAGVGTDGLIYIYGGGDGTVVNSTVDVYDPAADAWSAGVPVLTPRQRTAGTASIDNRLYMIGGEVLAATRSVETYIPGQASWATAASIPTARTMLAAATASDGTIYAVGGDTMAAETSFLDALIGGVWVARTPMPTARGNLAAVATPDGKLLAIGGHDEANVTFYNLVEIYDPTTNLWALGPPINHNRSDLAAAYAPDGRVYVVGGVAMGAKIQEVETYRPGAARWLDIAPLAAGHDAPAAVVAPDGRVLVFGGKSVGSTASATVEAYGPRITLNTASAPAGRTVAVAGENFAPSAAVRIYVDGIAVELVASDAAGSFISAFEVPAVPAGPHVILAVDDRAAYPVTRPFTIE